jgi:hypothetical protein
VWCGVTLQSLVTRKREIEKKNTQTKNVAYSPTLMLPTIYIYNSFFLLCRVLLLPIFGHAASPGIAVGLTSTYIPNTNSLQVSWKKPPKTQGGKNYSFFFVLLLSSSSFCRCRRFVVVVVFLSLT